jgi:1-deoxy-D-xylulose-5-phosphate reductoisomerase
MNAANERAVAAFLDRRIGFLDIPRVVAETLERMDRAGETADGGGDVVERAYLTDTAARRVADEVLGGLRAA